ncbi:uncharacterized protein LOC144173189 isoform X3 [Haemaphysalis longicornis]
MLRCDSGGILDFVFTAECVVNAISDLFLLAIVAYCLTCTLKGFIVWNTLSTVICWTASCMLHYERDQHFSGFHPYLALANETEFIQNSTVVAFVNQNFVPPLAFLYIATTLLAALKLVLLYGVYFGYLQAVCRGQLFNDPFQAYAREQDAAPLPSDFPATGRSIDSLVPQVRPRMPLGVRCRLLWQAGRGHLLTHQWCHLWAPCHPMVDLVRHLRWDPPSFRTLLKQCHHRHRQPLLHYRLSTLRAA